MNYLIPANTKRGQLILGLFRPFDLILVGCGIVATILLLALLPLSSTFMTVLALLPGGVCAILVTPLPYYHNVLNGIIEVYTFITNPQKNKYKWKGWCYKEWPKK